jgi:hypothetical protein
LFLDFTLEFVGKVSVFFLAGAFFALFEEVIVACAVWVGRSKV